MSVKKLSKEILHTLAQEYGTPLYVYDAEKVRDQYQNLLDVFPWKKKRLFYAMKANYNPAVLTTLRDIGASIDAVSPGDVLLAKKIGFKTENILFTANKISDDEMHEVKNLGVLFNIGSLTRLKTFAETYPGSKVCLRINPDVVAGENAQVMTGGADSKFGILLKDVPKALAIVKEHHLKVIGLHEHTGSGIPETTNILSAIRSVADLVNLDDFPDIEFLDFGGGFKVSYSPDEEELDYRALGFEASRLMENVSSAHGRDIELRFEPGKYLVAQAGYFLAKVTTTKQTPTKRFVGVNAGFPQLIRPMFYGSYHHIVNISTNETGNEKYDVVGNICETGDVFAEDRLLPKTKIGDILSIENAGAYCYSMGGVYNLRAMPSEVVVDGDSHKLVRKGMSSEELVNQILAESSNY